MIKFSRMLKRIIIIASISVLAVILVSILISLGVLAKELRNRNESLFTALNEQNKQLELLHSNAVDVSNDLNDVRSSLMLSRVEYPILASDSESSQENELLNYLLALDALVDTNRNIDAGIKFDDFINSQELIKVLDENSFSLEKTDSFSAGIKSGNSIIGTIYINPETPEFHFSDIISNDSVFSDNSQLISLLNNSISLIEQQKKLTKANEDYFKTITSDNRVKDSLRQNLARIIYTSSDQLEFELINDSDVREDVFSFSSAGNRFRSASGLETDLQQVFLNYLLEKISFIETRSESEINLENGQKIIDRLASDESFRLALKTKNLSLATAPREKAEDDDYIFYDITDPAGSLQGSFGILKSNGKIYVMNKNDLPVSAVDSITDISNTEAGLKKKAVIPDDVPEITDIFSNRESITFAAIGSHENDADTIILVHGNKKNNSLYLISIPRDIFYHGQKINNILKVFGPQKFIDELSVITGLKIEKFIQIDMYAFIDAVNIVGGIDIVLDEPVIDPTMKIVDNGVWGTLHYEAGPHHLNGKEALRLARSRHYSSDFARADRQQKLLIALKDSFYENKSISTIYEMVNTLIKHVDTNFTPVEIVNLLLAFKNAEIKKQEVLSTGNVLYSTFSELLKAEQKGYELAEDSYQGLWILMPVDNDWNKIRYYIRRIIGEVQDE